MKVLTDYAHHDPLSFCHGVLDRFTGGLRAAGHTSEVIDLYADKVRSGRQGPGRRELHQCRHPGAHGLARPGDGVVSVAGPALAREPGTARQIARRNRRPHPQPHAQRRPALSGEGRRRGRTRLRRPDPCAFPSILTGWIDWVWILDFGFGLPSAGWHRDVTGRIPPLQHKRVLLITSTNFDRNAYNGGIRDAIGTVTDDWGMRSPGPMIIRRSR